MALSDDRIAEMMRDTWGCSSIAPRHAAPFARAVEAEVHKDYTELILQLVEALTACRANGAVDGFEFDMATRAIKAGRARLVEGGQ